MTAILGLQYLGGVLMMADTEETLGGDAKSECEKLCRFTFVLDSKPKKAGTVLTGGAGDSHLIECANQGMSHFFQAGIKKETDVLVALSRFAKDFFKGTMEDYRGLDYRLVPNFEMLVAVSIKPQSMLFHWRGNRILRLRPYTHTAIGSGVTWLHPLLRDVQFSSPQESMLFHGMRMMFHAKRALVGVGGKTAAIALQDDGCTRSFGTDFLQKIESLVVNYEEFKTKMLDGNVSTIFSGDPKIDPELERNVEANWNNLARLSRDYRQAYKDIFKPSNSQTSGDQQ